MIIKCINRSFARENALTFNKEYEAEVSYDEYWVKNNNGDYISVPQEYFIVVSC